MNRLLNGGRQIAALAALVLVAVAGCSTDGGHKDGSVGGDPVYVFNRTVPDGREIPCLAYRHGVTCDWTNP